MKVISKIRREFRLTGLQLMMLGLNSSHSGNISVMEGETMFMTRSGAMLGCLAAADMMEATLHADPPEGISMEYPLHRAIYENTGSKAVLHCHPPHAIALSLESDEIVPLDLEGRHALGYVPVIRADADLLSIVPG